MCARCGWQFAGFAIAGAGLKSVDPNGSMMQQNGIAIRICSIFKLNVNDM